MFSELDHKRVYVAAASRDERATAGTGERGSTRPWRRLRQAVLTRDGDRCRYCGAPATAVHHLIPKTNGGRDDLTNLVAVCDRCHAQRHV